MTESKSPYTMAIIKFIWGTIDYATTAGSQKKEGIYAEAAN